MTSFQEDLLTWDIPRPVLRPVKAYSPVYYSTKMGKHADMTVRIEGKQQNTAP